MLKSKDNIKSLKYNLEILILPFLKLSIIQNNKEIENKFKYLMKTKKIKREKYLESFFQSKYSFKKLERKTGEK